MQFFISGPRHVSHASWQEIHIPSLFAQLLGGQDETQVLRKDMWFIQKHQKNNQNILVHSLISTSDTFRRSFAEASLVVAFHIASIFKFSIVINVVVDVISYFRVFAIQRTDCLVIIRSGESVDVGEVLEVSKNVIGLEEVICNLCYWLGLRWKRVSVYW